MPLFVSDGKTPDELPTAGGAGGGIPTAANWTKNTETLAGTKTLTDASETVQFLNPDGADRSVVLPALTTSSPFFYIFNTGTSGDLLLKQSAGTLIAIPPKGAARILSDGTSWSALAADGHLAKQAALVIGPFGGDPSSPPAFLEVSAAADAAVTGTQDTVSVLPLPVAGTIEVASRVVSGSNAATLELYQNTFLRRTIEMEGADVANHSFDGLAYDAGDVVSVRSDGTATAKAWFLLRTKEVGHILLFGGDFGLSSERWMFPGSTVAQAGNSSITYAEEAIVVGSYTITRLAYVIQSNPGGSHTFKIYKNGVLEATVGPGIAEVSEVYGRQGLITGLSIAVVAGDRIAISNDSLQYGETIVSLFLEGPVGNVYGFGSTNTANQYFDAGRHPGDGGSGAGSVGAGSEHIVLQKGTVVAVGHSLTGVASGNYELTKNGSSSETFAPSGANGLTTGLSTLFDEGDGLAVKTLDGNDGLLFVFME